MQTGGMGALGAVAHGQQGDGHQALHLRERCQELFRLEHAHIGGAKAQVRCLEHHLCHRDGGVDLTVVLAVGLPLPGRRRVIGHHQHHRRMEMGGRAAVSLFQGLRGLEHENALGLEIVGRGGIAARLQHRCELLRLHGAVTELAQGIPRLGQLGKIHGNLLLCSVFEYPDFSTVVPPAQSPLTDSGSPSRFDAAARRTAPAAGYRRTPCT